MQKAGSSCMFYLGWILVFAATSTCTILLFKRFSPDDAPWLPYAAWGAFEYGVLNWLHFHKHKSQGVYQMLISLVMTGISGLSICAATGLELVLLLNSKGFVTFPAWTEQLTLLALVGQICLNVLTFIGVSLTDPDHLAKLATLTPQPVYVESSLQKSRAVAVRVQPSEPGLWQLATGALRRKLQPPDQSSQTLVTEEQETPEPGPAQLPAAASSGNLLEQLTALSPADRDALRQALASEPAEAAEDQTPDPTTAQRSEDGQADQPSQNPKKKLPPMRK